MRLSRAVVGSLFASLSLVAAAQQDAPQEHVRGDVVRLQGDALEVRTRAGEVVRVKLGDQVMVGQLEKGDRSALATGAFVGTTAVSQPDGTLRAVEVHVFPESMRGRGEGHRPWDLRPGSSMTNATVSGVGSSAETGQSSMTNATVAGATGSGTSRTLTLRYAGGEQKVLVPKNVPIVKIEPGDRSLLVPGAHVFVIATRAGGVLTARAVNVGKGGIVPPM
jgi:hypothetical protein